jgi:hypothetical protein
MFVCDLSDSNRTGESAIDFMESCISSVNRAANQQGATLQRFVELRILVLQTSKPPFFGLVSSLVLIFWNPVLYICTMNPSSNESNNQFQHSSASIVHVGQLLLRLDLVCAKVLTTLNLLCQQAEDDDDDADGDFLVLLASMQDFRDRLTQYYAVSSSVENMLLREIAPGQCYPGRGALSGYHSTKSARCEHHSEPTRVDSLLAQPRTAWCVLRMTVSAFEELLILLGRWLVLLYKYSTAFFQQLCSSPEVMLPPRQPTSSFPMDKPQLHRQRGLRTADDVVHFLTVLEERDGFRLQAFDSHVSCGTISNQFRHTLWAVWQGLDTICWPSQQDIHNKWQKVPLRFRKHWPGYDIVGYVDGTIKPFSLRHMDLTILPIIGVHVNTSMASITLSPFQLRAGLLMLFVAFLVKCMMRAAWKPSLSSVDWGLEQVYLLILDLSV